MTPATSSRSPLHGTAQILRFNWPYYAVALFAMTGIIVGLRHLALPPLLVIVAWTALSASAWFTFASVIASWWVYDHSPLMQWSWVRDVMRSPRRWVSIHAGLDESSAALKALFPRSEGITLDIYARHEMSERSIERARRETGADQKAVVDYGALPLASGEIDAVFLFFAAHELRAPEARERLFEEIARVLASDGRLIVAEHLRDAANLAVYGPGFWHFLPRSEWLRVGSRAGFVVEREMKMTPFVQIWSFARRSPLP